MHCPLCWCCYHYMVRNSCNDFHCPWDWGEDSEKKHNKTKTWISPKWQKNYSRKWQKHYPLLYEKYLGQHFQMISGRLCHGSVMATNTGLILMGCSAIKWVSQPSRAHFSVGCRPHVDRAGKEIATLQTDSRPLVLIGGPVNNLRPLIVTSPTRSVLEEEKETISVESYVRLEAWAES